MRVYVDGVFDLFHYGHVRMLKRARELGDTLVVGVVTDADAQSYKRVPLMSLAERMEMVQSCRYVDEVVEAQLTLDQAFLHKHHIAVVVHGDDSQQDEFYAVPLAMGIMRYLPYTQSVSTTDIIQRCNHLPQCKRQDTLDCSYDIVEAEHCARHVPQERACPKEAHGSTRQGGV